MEPERASYEQLRARLDEAIALVDACNEQSLLDALRKLSGSAVNPLRVYVLGEELVVAVHTFSLVMVNLVEGKVRTWEDWRDRLASAARALADEVAKKLLTVLLDKGERVPEATREELSRIVTSIGKSGEKEFYQLLLELREVLRRVSY